MSGDSRRPIPVNYFIRIPNVGDRVNPLLVQSVSGRWVRHSASPSLSHLLAIGSMMAVANPMSHVWGTGVMHPDIGIGTAAAEHIYALRGKLSHSALRQGGVSVGDVPLGDPGYLAPAMLGISRAPMPQYKVGLVCHYVDRCNPTLRAMMEEDGVADLNVHDLPEVFLSRMAQCDTVISSSLHGLVFAEALGIPNLWIKAGNEIAGDDFKFRDWFSTTRQPGTLPHLLTANDTAEYLARRAKRHESTIDTTALAGAFPHEQLSNIDSSGSRPMKSIEACRTSPVPVFLISYNRGSMLKRSIAALRKLVTPTEIIIHDNGSTDADTLAILDELQATGIAVYRCAAIKDADDLNQVNETVSHYFSAWSEPCRYVVSDCDVDMSIADPHAIDVYDELLNKFRQMESVGPMLRICDIPREFPLFNLVMNRHIEWFWRHTPTVTETSHGEAAFLQTLIDTTFALHRAGEPFRRQKNALRVYEPFEAKHLDWYPLEMDGDERRRYADSSSHLISHWNNAIETPKYANVSLEHSQYRVVRSMPGGKLEFHDIRLNGSENSMSMQEATAASAIPGFAAATESQKEARISRTESLRFSKGSDVDRWRQMTSHDAGWGTRGAELARMVKTGESVFEFGAGLSVIPSALPQGCPYTPSDVAPLNPTIRIFDLNAPAIEPIVGHDVALFSGVLEYVHDLSRTAAFLAKNFKTVVCSYAVKTEGTSEEISKRRYSGWFTDCSEKEFTAIFSAAGFSMTERRAWNSQLLFRFDAKRQVITFGRLVRSICAPLAKAMHKPTWRMHR